MLRGSLLTKRHFHVPGYRAQARNEIKRRQPVYELAWRQKGTIMLIHIGFGNIVNTSKIIAIVSPESAPIKRLVQGAKEKGMAIDATQGRKTKSVLVMENSQIVLSALLPETIAGRVQLGQEDGAQTADTEEAGGV